MTCRRAIRTGSWLGPKAVIDARRIRRAPAATGIGLFAVILLALTPPSAALARRASHHVAPSGWPLEFPNGQYLRQAWSDVEGWTDDDQLSAFATFKASCRPIAAERNAPPSAKTLGLSLREPCRAARATNVKDIAEARAFFERHFIPLQISKLGDAEGFVTGYYEPVLEGSRTPSDIYTVPVYRRPSNLFVRGIRQGGELPNKGQVFRKIGRRKLVPYYERGEIEDGVLTGRGLEICYLKDSTDLLFMQIQGSGRIKLEDGSTLRLNYDAHNGWPYTPVGRILIERNIIPKEEMSMQRIREWMDANPDGAKELRRQNKSYVFFREVRLSDKDEAVGGQGVPLTPLRSIAVDRALHIYGTPFFITGKLPLESERAATPFHRLMIAQDTGSAIVGPARADIYFGAGAEAGRVSGRLRNAIRFTILVPASLDPAVPGARQRLPEPRPAETIAKLFPQTPARETPAKEAAPAVAPAPVPSPAASPATPASAADKPVSDKAAGDSKVASDKAPPNKPAADQPAPAKVQDKAPDKTASSDVAIKVPLPQVRPDIPSPPPRARRHRRYRW